LSVTLFFSAKQLRSFHFGCGYSRAKAISPN